MSASSFRPFMLKVKLLVQVRVWLESLATRCPDTVCLETQSTRHREWSPPVCVSTRTRAHTPAHTHTFVTSGLCSSAQRIHASSETYLALIRDDAYELQLRGEIEVKVNAPPALLLLSSGSSPALLVLFPAAAPVCFCRAKGG